MRPIEAVLVEVILQVVLRRLVKLLRLSIIFSYTGTQFWLSLFLTSFSSLYEEYQASSISISCPDLGYSIYHICSNCLLSFHLVGLLIAEIGISIFRFYTQNDRFPPKNCCFSETKIFISTRIDSLSLCIVKELCFEPDLCNLTGGSAIFTMGVTVISHSPEVRCCNNQQQSIES